MTRRIQIKKGLDIPLAGEPELVLEAARAPRSVAAVATDVAGIRPRMLVAAGDSVRCGDPLFEDKRNPGVPFTAVGCGEVVEINRGAKRSLQSVVIRLDGDDTVDFGRVDPADIGTLGRDALRKRLVDAGLWTAFRTRPFGRVPAVDAEPVAIFVTAIDTNPLAPDPAFIIGQDPEAFMDGINAILGLTAAKIYVCTAPDAALRLPADDRIEHVEFAGPHPAGLAGTHIHYLEPVSTERTVWHLGYQHVLAFGRLLTTGSLSVERIVSVGGPMVKRPRLLRTRMGASVSDILDGELEDGPVRVISGSILSGHRATGPLGYLGRYHRQITVIAEGEDREFMHWARPGRRKYSALKAFAGHLLKRDDFSLSTTQNGSLRALVPIGSYERVMPLDILATPLLKALVTQDTERAQMLGALELDEEDLALCSFVCSGKYEYGPALRENLDEIEING